MGTLAELEAEMYRLVLARESALRAAQYAINQANRDFDRKAVPLGRKIKKLKAEEEQKQASKQDLIEKRSKPVCFDGFTDAEIAHYRQLERQANHG